MDPDPENHPGDMFEPSTAGVSFDGIQPPTATSPSNGQDVGVNAWSNNTRRHSKHDGDVDQVQGLLETVSLNAEDDPATRGISQENSTKEPLEIPSLSRYFSSTGMASTADSNFFDSFDRGVPEDATEVAALEEDVAANPDDGTVDDVSRSNGCDQTFDYGDPSVPYVPLENGDASVPLDSVGLEGLPGDSEVDPGAIKHEGIEVEPSLTQSHDHFHEEGPMAPVADRGSKESLATDEVSEEEGDSPEPCKFFVESEAPLHHVGPALFDRSPSSALKDFHVAPSLSLNTVTDDDPFSTIILMSESDQRHDVWIPNPRTRQVLVTVAMSSPGTYFPDRDLLTMPGLVLVEEWGDPVRDLVAHYLGKDAATKRDVPTVDRVTEDEVGIQKLVEAGCYRAAVNLTGRILTKLGQGAGRLGHPSRHTAFSIQVWCVRIALLMKLRQYATAFAEAQPFENADKPDLYYEFYPETSGIRKGSMVSFAFRVLLAEVQLYNARVTEALDQLCDIHNVVKQILKNLHDGLCEDGSAVELTEASRKASLELWESRERKLLYSILNCTVAQQDYMSAVCILDMLRERDASNAGALWSAQGRILLQLGDINAAQSCFGQALTVPANGPTAKFDGLLDKSMLCIAQNDFADALGHLQQAREIRPNNPVVINNIAVCLLYMGKLKQALKELEDAIDQNPKSFLYECVLFNVCTLYELETSSNLQKKIRLLEVVSRHLGDGFNTTCLKLPSKS